MDAARTTEIADRVTGLLLLAGLCVGLAWLACLPPWEGFDETAHWSYVQQMADTGRAPTYGVDRIAADVDAYRGPMRYGETPPFESTGRLTYRDAARSTRPLATGGPTMFRQGRSLNWQSQHPPLYYILMTAPYRMAHALGWVGHLFVLRLVSFLLAFAGLAIGVVATSAHARAAPGGRGVWVGPIMAAWPFLFPQFIPEFARLGNDSLCLLLASVAWALLLDLFRNRRPWAASVLLGLTLGFGLLTKAFFVPISAGVGAVMLARALINRRPAEVAQAGVAGALALAIGGGWYLARQAATGSLIGADEFIRLNALHSGGAAAVSVSAPDILRGLAAIPGTFLWAGSWSLARLPEVGLLAPGLTLGLVLLDYGRSLPRPSPGWDGDDLLAWAPVALAAPLAAGLLYHVYAWAAGAAAVTPGWYFHILAAPLGFAVARGWNRPRALTVTVAATAAFTLASWAAQASMYGGCAAKLGADKHYSLEGARCLIDLHALGALGWPLAGAVLLAAGLVLAGAAAALALSCARAESAAGEAGEEGFIRLIP